MQRPFTLNREGPSSKPPPSYARARCWALWRKNRPVSGPAIRSRKRSRLPLPLLQRTSPIGKKTLRAVARPSEPRAAGRRRRPHARARTHALTHNARTTRTRMHEHDAHNTRTGLVAELPSNLARGLSGRRDFGPRMGGTLSTHSTLTTRASTVLYSVISPHTQKVIKTLFGLIDRLELFNTRDVGSNLDMHTFAFFAYCTQCEVAHRTSAAE